MSPFLGTRGAGSNKGFGFASQRALVVEYLVVAGGAGFDTGTIGEYGGGSGAGGLLNHSGKSLVASTNYTLTIGAGGNTTTGIANNSVFDNSTALAGGLHGYAVSGGIGYVAGASGGSGGGGPGYSYVAPNSAGQTWSGGAATQGNSGGATGFGNAGGSGRYNGSFVPMGGGGGGAGAVGENAAAVVAGNGGAGQQYSISGTALFYAGGGGGAAENGTRGTGGSSIGGNGAQYLVSFATNGAINTGSGGGGGVTSMVSPPYPGGAGGSGVVVLKYPDAYTATFSGGVSHTTSAPAGGFKISTITAAGLSDTVSWA